MKVLNKMEDLNYYRVILMPKGVNYSSALFDFMFWFGAYRIKNQELESWSQAIVRMFPTENQV